MKTHFVAEQHITYDGRQLAPHWIYRQHDLMGDAAVAFVGPCQVDLSEMVDIEDVKNVAPIYSPLMLLSHKAIRAVADFQGQKVRSQGGAPIQVEPLKKVGVLPVSLPLGEALPAMQNRTIDGMVAAAAPFVAFKYYDIAKPMTFLPATMFAAPVVANRAFMKSLGPQLEAIVREESRKAEVLFSDWNIADIKRAEETWKKNGGEIITLPPPEAKRYIDLVTPVATSLLSANPKIKEDYQALLAAAATYRQ
jgi:C4-dicarboxylate-binding protein DctP